MAADVRTKGGYHGRIKERECRVCHTDHKGRAAKIVILDEGTFDHKQTDFLLLGAHVRTKCVSCHAAGRKFSQTLHGCNDCHAKDDKHKRALGSKCADCHSEANWKETRFDHNRTKYPLKFKHEKAKCLDCHEDQRFQNTPRDCYSCHKKDDDEKGHRGRFGEKCQTCHNEKAWKPATCASRARTAMRPRAIVTRNSSVSPATPRTMTVPTGGGDSAMEAAVAVAGEPGARVTRSYLGEAFGRVKQKNRERLSASERAGQPQVALRSTIARIAERHVILDHDGRQLTLANDNTIVCAGGVLLIPMLREIGVMVETKFGAE